jgi:hypothetical protein
LPNRLAELNITNTPVLKSGTIPKSGKIVYLDEFIEEYNTDLIPRIEEQDTESIPWNQEKISPSV